MGRVVRGGFTAAAFAAALVVGACAPAPPSEPPPTPPTPAPLRSGPGIPDCPSHGAGTAASGVIAANGATAATADEDEPAELTIVAVDDTGRPEIVATTPALAGATSRSLDASRDLEVIAVEADRQMSTATPGGAGNSLVDAARSVGAAGAAIEAGAMAVTGEPRRSEQWALDDLAIEPAWATSRGAGVDIAVVDSGVTGTHVDLATKLCGGVAFLGSNGVEQRGAGTTDANGHGTHVAGIAAAAANGVGVAGVAPDARIIPVRVLDAGGTGASSDVARGITWAVDHGAEVVNLSLGGPRTAAVETAVAYAERQGVVVVAAAGNDGPGGPVNYPAALDTALGVASYDEDHGLSWFSTRGNYVDLAAPGSGIVSTTNNGRWSYMSGTSMATPHVAGTAALLKSAEPALSPSQVRSRLTANAREAGPIGHDVGFGWGRIDPLAALRR